MKRFSVRIVRSNWCLKSLISWRKVRAPLTRCRSRTGPLVFAKNYEVRRSMDVFALRERVVNDYKNYIESFVRIRDKRIDGFVHEQFSSGALWPDPILQLNPAYEPGPTLDDLAAKGLILPETAKFFRRTDGGP